MYRFNRQFPINTFVVDFYCRKKKLAIEVDGSIHQVAEVEEQDKARQELLESLGIIVLRFSNDDIIHRIDEVVQKIEALIKTLP